MSSLGLNKSVLKPSLLATVALLVFCMQMVSLAQTPPSAAQRSRSLEKSGQQMFEQGVRLYRRDTDTDKRDALNFFLLSAEDFKGAGATGKQAMAMLLAGLVSKSLREDRQSLGHFKEALLLFQKLKHRPGQIDALINIGVAYYSLGEMDDALRNFDEALELSRKGGERRGAANALCGVAQVCTARKEFQKALDAYTQALPILKALGDRDGEERVVNNIRSISAELAKSNGPKK